VGTAAAGGEYTNQRIRKSPFLFSFRRYRRKKKCGTKKKTSLRGEKRRGNEMTKEKEPLKTILCLSS
jgi:hypothetical protein